jgi:cytochrome c peroxidase
MLKTFTKFLSLLSIAGFVLTAAPATAEDEEMLKSFFNPLPSSAPNDTNGSSDAKVELGKMLYFEPRLSKSGVISCATCHNLSTGGVDNLPTSIGHGWQRGGRNAPTVLNAAFEIAQFWDGRANDLEEQARGPILNPIEMAATEELVIKRLSSIPQYPEIFAKAFPRDEKPLTYDNVARAIAAFERTLITPSRFDDYLRGTGSLEPEELKGLGFFVTKGCVACHGGVGVGGAAFKKFDYGEDDGRFNVTKNEADKKVFRVASLRNVALTYPYFHDGKVADLKEAVKTMGLKQLSTNLSDEEVSAITAFLGTLTGRLSPVTMPALPPSTIETPAPDFN